MESLIAIPILAIAASYFEIYKVKTITVAYQDQFGRVRGYKFDYAGENLAVHFKDAA